MYQYINPKGFYQIAGRMLPWLQGLWPVLLLAGLISGLFIAPADYQQGDAFRIIYWHVPSAFLSLSLYAGLAAAAGVFLIWRIKLAEIIFTRVPPLGAWMTFLALATGAIWGKPMWGTWWIWDARLTSELILLLLYLAIILLDKALINHPNRGEVLAIVILVGLIDIPIIHYSVNWWQTLHQGASLSLFSKPTISGSMLYPLLIMWAALGLFCLTQLLVRIRTEIKIREHASAWLRKADEVLSS